MDDNLVRNLMQLLPPVVSHSVPKPPGSLYFRTSTQLQTRHFRTRGLAHCCPNWGGHGSLDSHRGGI